MCHDDGTERNTTLGEYGDYMCDAPKVSNGIQCNFNIEYFQPLIQLAIDESARIFPNPDLIIWTGDNVAHIDGYGWESKLFSCIYQYLSIL